MRGTIGNMFTMKIGEKKVVNRQSYKRLLQYVLVLMVLLVAISAILQKFNYVPNVNFSALAEVYGLRGQINKPLVKQKAGPCATKNCPEDHYSFSILSGAANVLGPKICVQNKLVLGLTKDNAGSGINIVVINGKTGDVAKTGHFNMYDGDVQPLIEFLHTIEYGFAVLIATADEPATKLNDEVRKLIGELGSSAIQSVGYRDNWVFVGGKGAAIKTNFEKHIKNEHDKNKYDGWPEMIDLEGCIPQFLE